MHVACARAKLLGDCRHFYILCGTVIPRWRDQIVDESINSEHGEIEVLAVLECCEASTLFSKINTTVS